MKKLLAASVILLGVSSASAGLLLQGKDGVPQGSLCCINKICLMAKNEADCAKAGGVTIKDCKECENAVPEKK